MRLCKDVISITVYLLYNMTMYAMHCVVPDGEQVAAETVGTATGLRFLRFAVHLVKVSTRRCLYLIEGSRSYLTVSRLGPFVCSDWSGDITRARSTSTPPPGSSRIWRLFPLSYCITRQCPARGVESSDHDKASVLTHMPLGWEWTKDQQVR